ncbi:hypothetical protein [Streptomyces sp. NPDC018972]|jgi:hypothetical protein|uniref:hypothetical protein n=1 Tax=Streptomyces sp. NPDC018972 TaxID=3365060 RepID=UPI0037A84C48
MTAFSTTVGERATDGRLPAGDGPFPAVLVRTPYDRTRHGAEARGWARRHGPAARPVGSWQQADPGAALGAAPDRDRVVHALALGTRHADEENPT